MISKQKKNYCDEFKTDKSFYEIGDKTFSLQEYWQPLTESYSANVALTQAGKEIGIGVAELSLDNNGPTKGLPKKYLYFNRIKTRPEKQGMGTLLMKRLCHFADTKHLIIYAELNPYGELNLNQLISFYQRFGFKISKQYVESNIIIGCTMIRKNTRL